MQKKRKDYASRLVVIDKPAYFPVLFLSTKIIVSLFIFTAEKVCMRWIVFISLTISLSSCWMIRAYRVREFNLTDIKKMPSVTIQKSDAPYPFIEATTNAEYALLKTYLDTSLPKSLSAAFIVIRNDSLIYENYFNGFNRQSLLPSFSVAKSFVSTLISIALAEGKISSLQQPITDYIPELAKRDARFSNITLQHLLDMKSGLHFNEGTYDLKDNAIRLGFKRNLRKNSLKVAIDKAPGGAFHYQSINTELLALALEKATGKKLSTYLLEKLWQPLGAEQNATWNIDSKKHKQEIAFAGLNATARDFARLGLLYVHNGLWNGTQILEPSWVRTINNSDSMNKAGGYKSQFWSQLLYQYFTDSLSAMRFVQTQNQQGALRKKGKLFQVSRRANAFHAEGLLNQFIYINPDKHLVIVRLGHNWYHPTNYAGQFIYELGERL